MAAVQAMGMADRPLGTVTLLFTDIEGSTRLWEQFPEAMHHVIARHDKLLREAIEHRDGYVFKTVGDAFCAAFAVAPDALEAALALQVALRDEAWGEVGAIKVRAALHTGAVQDRDDDYFGPPLNRVARLLSAGHGGQTLLSLPAAELVRDELPPGVTLRDMGDRRLKDLIRPEHVFQVVAPGLPEAFPPLRTLDARRHNLPPQPTPLVGREDLVHTVRRRVLSPEVRLLTLTGPGGTGKTRLGLQVAADLIDDFEYGVFFVPLAAVEDAGLVPDAIAQALGVREESGLPALGALKRELREQSSLIVLDNCEQVTDIAPVVGELLTACPLLKLLATSRIPLHVYGERELAVPPLALPDPRRLPPPERMSQYEAVRLFVERTLDVRPDFTLTVENAPAVAEICWRLDGLPLAIELAAARGKLLSPTALLARLDRRLPLLTGGGRDRPSRQQTLRNLIAWSWDLLTADEQVLFRRLAAFGGGCTLAAAEAVCADGESGSASGQSGIATAAAPGVPEDGLIATADVLDGLASLADKSLLRCDEAGSTDEDPRFVMLQTIHEFASEQLAASPEAETLRRRHASYFLALAEEAQPNIYGPDQAAWLERLESEHDNLRAALRWLELGGGTADSGSTGGTQGAGGGVAALRLAAALWGFWLVRGHLREGRQHLERLLATVVPGVGESVATSGGNGAAVGTSDGRAHQVDVLCAQSLNGAGTIAMEQGDYARAGEWLRLALALWRKAGNEHRAAGVLLNLGLLERRQRDFAAARAAFEESLAIYERVGAPRGVAHALNNLGVVALEREEYAAAQPLLERSLEIKRALGDKRSMAASLNNLAEASLELGDLAAARAHCTAGLTLRREVRDEPGIVDSLEVLACLVAGEGDGEQALQLAGSAAALRERTGVAAGRSHEATLERWLALARETLPAPAQEEAWKQGREMSLEAAMESALAVTPAG